MAQHAAESQSTPPDANEPIPRPGIFDALRRLTALAIVGFFAIGGLLGSFKSCSVSTKATEQITLCGAPQLTDAAVLAWIAIVGALLWPDITEIDALGFRLKRRIEQTESAIRLVERELTTVEQRISMKQTASSQANVLVLSRNEISAVVSDLDSKVAEFTAHEPDPTAEIDSSLRLKAQSFQQRLSILDERMAAMQPADLERFSIFFHQELRIVRGIDNSLRAGMRMSNEDLELGLHAIDALLPLLDGSE